jgi:uncharacterized protein YdeI (YjbR/CyaY-like superfamily)
VETHKDLPALLFKTQAEWTNWLEQNHSRDQGVWLKFAKKNSGESSVNYEEALEGALCYGWIDAVVNKLDDKFYLQKFTPRRPKSIWSKRNVAKVEALIKAGKMQPPGQAAVEAAKEDGRWDQAYESAANATVPEDFEAALKMSPVAREFFDTLSKTNRYAVIWRIQTAKKPETRAAKIAQMVAMLERGEKLH